jgi:tetratricopeptide (TPR) repeat protein
MYIMTNFETNYLVNPVYSTGLHFVHRGLDLLNLKNTLDKDGSALVVQGIGGIGKSALMQQFVKIYGIDYENILFLEIDSKFGETKEDAQYNRESLARAFFKNNELPKNVEFSYDSEKTELENLPLLLNHVRKLKGKNLMVLDNVSTVLEEWINDLPHTNNWSVLLSSRENIAEYTPYPLLPLSNDELIDLFNRYYSIALHNAGFTPDEADKFKDDSILASILKDIGHHTLTTELLAKTAGVMAWTVHELQIHVKDEDFNFKQKINATFKGETELRTLWAHIMARFAISLPDEVQNILRYFSVLPSMPLPFGLLSVLFNMEGDSNGQLRDTLDLLTRKGWLIRRKGAWECHSIIQKVVRDKLKPDVVNCARLFVGLENSLLQDDTTNLKEVEDNDLIAVGESIVKSINALPETQPLICIYLSTFSNVLNRFEKALEFAFLDLSISEKNLEKDKKELSAVYFTIASNYLRLGNPNEALSYALKSQAINEIVFGENDVEMFQDYVIFSQIYLHLGNYEKSQFYNQKLYVLLELHPELNNVESALYFIQLANTCHAQRNYVRGLEAGLKSIEILDNNTDVLPQLYGNTYLNVAIIYNELDDFTNTILYANKAIEQYKAYFKEDDLEFAEVFYVLATGYRTAEDFDLALMNALKAKDIYEKHYGSDNILMSSVYDTIARIYDDKNDHDNALIYARQNIEIGEKKLHNEHPRLGTFYNTIAKIYLEIDDLESASSYALKSVILRERILEGDNPDLSASYNTLIRVYSKMGLNDLAIEIALKDIRNFENKKKPNDPILKMTFLHLANIYVRKNQYSESLEYALKALRIAEKMDNNTNSLISANWQLASIYYYLKDYPKAIEAIDSTLNLFNSLPLIDENRKVQIINWQKTIYDAAGLDN